MTTRDEVVSFLNLFKGAAMLELFYVRDRPKNIQGLLDLGISVNERKEKILGLTPDNYMSGPKPDDTDARKEIWEFGTNVEGIEVYIKLQVTKDPKRQSVYYANVWSFHRAEYRIRYPLRGNSK